MMGHGSTCGLMSYGDANAIAMEIGEHEVLPVVEEIPVIFMAFDLIESQGKDIRTEPLRRRRAVLERILGQPGAEDRFHLSEILADASWEDLTGRRRECRTVRAEGLMLKDRESPYEADRHRGGWWKWKIEPYTMDAVLIYAQPGHGSHEQLYSDYTFGLWRRGELVPVAAFGGDPVAAACDAIPSG